MKIKIDNFKQIFNTDENNRLKIISLKAEIFDMKEKFSFDSNVEREAKYEAIKFNKNMVSNTIET